VFSYPNISLIQTPLGPNLFEWTFYCTCLYYDNKHEMHFNKLPQLQFNIYVDGNGQVVTFMTEPTKRMCKTNNNNNKKTEKLLTMDLQEKPNKHMYIIYMYIYSGKNLLV